jgi:hypothetical protein
VPALAILVIGRLPLLGATLRALPLPGRLRGDASERARAGEPPRHPPAACGGGPHLAAESHPIRNGDLAPEQVTAGSGRVVWWQCAGDPEHEWQAKVIHRTTRGARCPHCVHPREPTPGLAAARPDLAAEWHQERNGGLTPDTVSAGSSRPVWWRRARDGRHDWPARVQARVRNDTGCPYLAERARGAGCPRCRGQDPPASDQRR